MEVSYCLAKHNIIHAEIAKKDLCIDVVFSLTICAGYSIILISLIVDMLISLPH